MRFGRAVDEVGEAPSQRLVLAAAAAIAFLLGLATNPPFLWVRPVYPRVHRLLLRLPRRRLGVRRARGGNDDDGARAPPVAGLVPVEERREGARGRGCCHGVMCVSVSAPGKHYLRLWRVETGDARAVVHTKAGGDEVGLELGEG